MNRFLEQCEDRKLTRLQHLAEAALHDYGLSGSGLTFIGQTFNAIFRVDADGGERYVLRIHRFNVYDALEMRSELEWLDYLRKSADVLVSEPVANKHGDFVTELAIDDVPGRHYCTLLRWHDGRPLEEPAPNHQCYMAGELIAKLHLRSTQFVAPTGFTRPWRGIGYPQDCVKRIRSTAPPGLFSAKVLKVLDATADHVGEVMAEIRHGSDDFGMIHADLHGGNLLFHGRTVRAIDFDGCGWGHYLYDLAITTYHLAPQSARLVVAGYRRNRKLSWHELEKMRVFYALRILDQLAYQLPDAMAAAQTLTRLRPYDLLGRKLPRGLPSLFETAPGLN
ncbi:MAG: phosphotransferase [Tepidisphaeraceae bacterium]